MIPPPSLRLERGEGRGEVSKFFKCEFAIIVAALYERR